MHTQGMKVEECERMFREEAFQDPGNARQQAARGTFDPGYLNYALGKLMIRKLRDDWTATARRPRGLGQVPRRVAVVRRAAGADGAQGDARRGGGAGALIPRRAAVVRVGTAGWSIPRSKATAFPGEGTHLARYARVLPFVEINSSFYRPHRREVYRKWAAQTPRSFRFGVKLPREITHDARLRDARSSLREFLEQAGGLGRRLGPLLVQLPPSLDYERQVADRFFALVRERHAGDIVCEPRHRAGLPKLPSACWCVIG